MQDVKQRPVKIISLYINSVSILLFLTAAVKLVTSFGNDHLFQSKDPILFLSFRQVFQMVALVELGIAAICLLAEEIIVPVSLVAWLASNFLIYRISLFWIGYHGPCHCLGYFTDMLHISPQIADTAMKIILCYLLIGSYAGLFWLWRERRKTSTLVMSQ